MLLMHTSLATTKAASCNLTSKYASFAPSKAENRLDWNKSAGTMGG